jgi:hypothetical protein
MAQKIPRSGRVLRPPQEPKDRLSGAQERSDEAPRRCLAASQIRKRLNGRRVDSSACRSKPEAAAAALRALFHIGALQIY